MLYNEFLDRNKGEKMTKIIIRWAVQFSPSLKEDIDDLIQEGYMCYMELLKYEEEYGLDCSFEAALSNHIKTTFLIFYKKNKAAKRTGEMIDFAYMEEMMGKNPWRKIEEYISLSKEMREVADVVLSAPQEFIDLIRMEDFKTGLSKYMRKYKGWSLKKVNQFWEEFKLKENV